MFESITSLLGQASGTYTDYVTFAVLLVAALAVALLVGKAINFGKHRLATKSSTNLDDIMLESVKGPIQAGIMLVALYIGMAYLPLLDPYAAEMNTAFAIIFPFYLAYFASRIVGGVIQWYGTDIAAKTESKVDDQFLPIVKKAAYGAIFGIMIVVMLSQLGIRVETVIAAMGIGGLAVALALQPTLSNFFSGVHMVLDRPIRIGDYVELDTLDKGTVIDIGWRSTKIRTYANNIIVIPNTKLADSKIVNYSIPDPSVGFFVDCGVAYDTDLDKAEKVALETAKEIMASHNGDESFTPFVRFREFGSSSINFRTVMRVKTLGDSYLSIHEFIKKLKKAFDREGIEIAFPQMDVHLDGGARKAVRKSPRRKR